MPVSALVGNAGSIVGQQLDRGIGTLSSQICRLVATPVPLTTKRFASHRHRRKIGPLIVTVGSIPTDNFR